VNSREPIRQPLLKKLLGNPELSHQACLAFTDILHIPEYFFHSCTFCHRSYTHKSTLSLLQVFRCLLSGANVRKMQRRNVPEVLRRIPGALLNRVLPVSSPCRVQIYRALWLETSFSNSDIMFLQIVLEYDPCPISTYSAA